MITRRHAFEMLSRYVGQDLRPLAEKLGVTVVAENGNINKGWKGITLEHLAGVPNNRCAGLNFELNSVSYYMKEGVWLPKETMAVMMLDPDEVEQDYFFHSYLWEKLKSIIFCAVSWNGRNNTESKLLKVSSLDFWRDEQLIKKVVADYEFIRYKLQAHGYESMSSRDGKYIQTRTKGTGYGSTTRAFYAKKNFLKEICPPFKAITKMVA